MSAMRLVTVSVWFAAIASIVWTASIALPFEAAADAEMARVKDRAAYIWRSQVAAGLSTDSASADVLELITRELFGGNLDTPKRLPFIKAFDSEALWVSYNLNPIVDRVHTLPRTHAESLSLRVAQSKFNRLFRDHRPTVEATVRARAWWTASVAAGALAVALLLTWYTRRRPLLFVALPTVLAFMLLPVSMVHGQSKTFAIRGIIQAASDSTPLTGAIIALTGARFERQVRSDETGRFSVGAVPTGSYRLSVLRLGYQALTQSVAVGDRDAQLTITLTVDPKQLNTIVTRANVTAIYGGIGAVGSNRNAAGDREMNAVAGATLQVVGSGQSTKTDSSGRFFLELGKPGLYMVRVSSLGLAPQFFPVEVPRNTAVDVSRMLDSTRVTAPTGRDYLYAEMDQRLKWRPRKAALVTGSELREFGGALSDALRRSRSMNTSGLRLGHTTCVFLNGIARPGMPVDAIDLDEIDAIELYADGSDPTGTIARGWPRGAQCGIASRLPPPSSNGLGPPIARYAVVWTQR